MADLETIVAYLLGEGELDGKWFGDPDVPLVAGKYKARYWWRSHLREAWNNRHGAGDAERSAELTTAWMAGAESVRDRAAEDSARLDWMMRNISGRELREMGVQTDDGCTRAAIDAAKAGDRG